MAVSKATIAPWIIAVQVKRPAHLLYATPPSGITAVLLSFSSSSFSSLSFHLLLLILNISSHEIPTQYPDFLA
jgi:hypothetical protein